MPTAGRAEYARAVRRFVSGVPGTGHPGRYETALLVSELSGNSVRHSRSGKPGGTVTVAVTAGGAVVRVEVADPSGAQVPKLHPADSDNEDGRGPGLVAAVAARWGWRRCGSTTVTWFELQNADTVPLPSVTIPLSAAHRFAQLWRGLAPGFLAFHSRPKLS